MRVMIHALLTALLLGGSSTLAHAHGPAQAGMVGVSAGCESGPEAGAADCRACEALAQGRHLQVSPGALTRPAAPAPPVARAERLRSAAPTFAYATAPRAPPILPS